MATSKAKNFETVKITVAVQMVYIENPQGELEKHPINTIEYLSFIKAEDYLREKNIPFDKILNIMREKLEYEIPFETLESTYKI